MPDFEEMRKAVENATSQDIVTRLRFALEHFRNDPQPVLLEDAADEIEYLRNEIAEHHNEYQKLWNKHNAVMRDRKYPLTNDYIGDI
jgi:predicted esterase YcpF (UPF0227 family)